jgi:transcription initiation factor TFIIE subunit beta
MNSLEQQRKAFKARLIKQPIIKRNIVHRNEPSNAHSVTNFENKLHNKIFEARRMQKKQSYELPVAGSKLSISQQMYNVINYLKEHEGPHTAEDLKEFAKVDIYSSEDLLNNLTHNDKITYDPENNTFTYKPLYDIKNKEDLLKLVREHKAMEVRGLNDSYSSNLIDDIKELEKEGEILVIYSKENPRIIYANEKELNVEMDKEFKELWHSLTVPAEEELSKELKNAGLKSMEVFEAKVNPKNTNKKKTKQRKRKVKIINTHLDIDLTKDYVKQKK